MEVSISSEETLMKPWSHKVKFFVPRLLSKITCEASVMVGVRIGSWGTEHFLRGVTSPLPGGLLIGVEVTDS